nr:zinc finger MYM-type protein 1-like [Coffea arabica]
MKAEYQTRLLASIDCARYLLHQGLAFRGHDESDISENHGNFLELLHFLVGHNDDIKKVVLENAPKNLKLIAPDIQKDISNALASETTSIIVNDIGHGLFAILCDESRVASTKEQLVVVIRYVDSHGYVIERFLGILHVRDTTSLSLKKAIDDLFSKHGLSISQIRGQGYDGASNMRGEYNGLKTLIMKENGSAYNIHCFAHQLQLSLVGVAKKHVQVSSMYNTLSTLVHVLEGSSKRQEILREQRLKKVVDDLMTGDLLVLTYDSVIDVLLIIENDGLVEQRGQAYALLNSLQSFEFAFILHLMKKIMGITNALSEELQRKDQDIVNAMGLVKVSKQQLQATREDGWDFLLDEVCLFCEKHEIIILKMDEMFITSRRSRRKVQQITNLHHYRVELFCAVIDLQLQGFNNRFNEINMELLLCMACLNPSDSFAAFDKKKLIRLAEHYPCEFSKLDILALDTELDTYINDLKSAKEFLDLRKISDLAQRLVETKRDIVYPLLLPIQIDANEQEAHGVQVDLVKVPQDPVTRARVKRFKESLQALVHAVQAQKKPPIEGINMEDPCKTTKILLTIAGASDQASKGGLGLD